MSYGCWATKGNFDAREYDVRFVTVLKDGIVQGLFRHVRSDERPNEVWNSNELKGYSAGARGILQVPREAPRKSGVGVHPDVTATCNDVPRLLEPGGTARSGQSPRCWIERRLAKVNALSAKEVVITLSSNRGTTYVPANMSEPGHAIGTQEYNKHAVGLFMISSRRQNAIQKAMQALGVRSRDCSSIHWDL